MVLESLCVDAGKLDPPKSPLKRGTMNMNWILVFPFQNSGSPFSRGLGGSGVLIPTAGLFKHPLREAYLSKESLARNFQPLDSHYP